MGFVDMFSASEKATITVPELARLIDMSVRYDLTRKMLQADIEVSEIRKVLDVVKEDKVVKNNEQD